MISNFVGLIIFIFIIICFPAIAQEKKSVLPNEFTVSINTSLVEDEDTENRMGFGFGMYHYYSPEPFLDLIFGLEFNQVSQFKYNQYNGHYSDYDDITYKFNYLSVRFIPRFITGKKFKFFCDPGLQFDLPLIGSYSGTLNSYSSYTGHKTSKTESGRWLPGVNLDACIGAGMMRSFEKFSLYLKPEYKIGFTKEYDWIKFRNRYLYLTLGVKI